MTTEDENQIKMELLNNITFMCGMFTAYCDSTGNRQLFGYGMNILREYIMGTLKETEETSLTDELMRSYS